MDKDGYVTLKGGANPQAAVFAYNTRTGQGGIDTADDGGQYEIRLKAQLGDDIDLWQEDTGGRSPSIRITIKKLGAPAPCLGHDRPCVGHDPPCLGHRPLRLGHVHGRRCWRRPMSRP